jgi:hypothetical protein
MECKRDRKEIKIKNKWNARETEKK